MASIIVPISVPGAPQAAQQIAQVGTAAQKTATQVNQIGGPNSLASLNRLGSAGAGAVGGVNGLTDALTRNAGSLAYLLRTIAPIGGGFAVMAAQAERGALMIERMAGAAGGHITQQQVLNAALKEGAVSAATLESAVASVTSATQAAQASTQAYAAAQAATAQVSKDLAAAQLLVAQRRQDVLVTKQGGDPKADAIAQRDLNAALIDGNALAITKREALMAEAPLRQQAINDIKAQGEAERVLAEANQASSFSLGATVGVIAGVIAILVALAAALYAVKKAYDIVTESIKAAAAEQTADTTFKGLVGNAQEAEAALNKLKAFRGAAGIFSLEDLEQAAIKLKNAGAATQNVVGYTEALATAAARVHTTVDSMADAFLRAMMGRMQKPSNEMILLIRQIAIDAGITDAKVRTMFQTATPEQKIRLLTEALQRMGEEGGVAFGAIQERQDTWEGTLAVLNTRWQVFLEALGKPIIDALTPILKSWGEELLLLKPKGEEWGKVIAGWITNTNEWAKSIVNARDVLAPLLTMAQSVPFVGPLLGLGGTALAAAGPGGKPEPVNVPTKEDLTPALVAPGMDKFVGGLERKKGGNEWTDTFKSDTSQINDMWEKFGEIQSHAGTDLERNRMLMDTMLTTADKLFDPSQLEGYITALEKAGVAHADLIIKQAVELRQQKALDEEIKIGGASAWDSFERGAQKALSSIDNVSKAWERVGAETVQILTNDISQGLSDIVDGTKGVAQGFKDMVVSILKDLSQMALKIAVEIALLQTLKAIGMSGLGGGGVVGLSNGGSISNKQTGGPIYGGSGSRDDVHIMAMGGEYMLQKSAVRSAGLDMIELLNRGQARIVPKARHMADGGDIDIPPADMSPTFTTAPSTEPGGAMNPAFPTSPYQQELDYFKTMAANAANPYGRDELDQFQKQNPDATHYDARASLGNAGWSAIGAGISGGPTSFESASSGLYGAFEGGTRLAAGFGLTVGGGSWPGAEGGIGALVKQLREGGYIYPMPSFETGGVMPWTGPAFVHAGERITPAGSQPSNVTNNITVHVEYSGGNASSAKTKTTGADDQDARSLAKAIQVTVVSEIAKQRQFGGELYQPRNR